MHAFHWHRSAQSRSDPCRLNSLEGLPEKWEGLAIGPQLANGSYVVLVGTDLISDGAALSMNALVIGEPRARSTSLAMFFPAGPISMGQIMRPIAGLDIEFGEEPGGKYFVWLERGGYSHTR